MEARRDVFQAISDPTRRAIIMLLAVGAMTPNAIAEHFSTSRQAVSKHLKILTECDILFQEQQGREIQYRINAHKVGEIEKWVDDFKQLVAGRFNQLDMVLNHLKSNKI